MTIRNLEFAFAPGSVAVIGASARPGSVGQFVFSNIREGGFGGAVFPVNPRYAEIDGVACYPRVGDLPAVPDLAVIATPPRTVPGLIGELGAAGVKAAVVITAGLTGEQKQKMLDAARPHLLRIIGPNTIGLLAPRLSLNASFVHIAPQAGRLALVSQSGAIVSSVVDWAATRGIGFSQVLSLGDMADVDIGDCLNMLATSPETSAILVYLESVPAPRKFMSAARAAARVKPVIAVKPGRHAEAARAALTHTGALAGADRVVDAALRRAGIIRVDDLEDLFEAAEVTARFRPIRSGRVGIVTNGGGAGVLAVDQLLDRGSSLAELGPETLAALDRALPSTWSHANPVDIIGDAPPERYATAVSAVAADPDVDAMLVMNCPTALAEPAAAARKVAGLAREGLISGKPVLACWLGDHAAAPARAVLRQSGIASFDTPAGAADAVAMLTRWSDVYQAMVRVPESDGIGNFDRSAAEEVIRAAAAAGRTLLTEPEAKAVVAAYGIATPETVVAPSPEAAAEIAAGMLGRGNALVLKLYSETITHKSDVGGVVLGLKSPEAVRTAAEAMRARLEKRGLSDEIGGFSVQPMIRRPHGRELIIGVSTDPVFGPVILFGAGGTAVEVLDDTAMGLVPLDDVLAGDLIDRTRISRLLAGYRDVPPADRSALVAALLGLSQLAVDLPVVTSVDINPLLADSDGTVALDARIAIDPARLAIGRPNPALAIRPYPSGWSKQLALEGLDVIIRPIRPADAELYPAFLARVDPEDMRRRFLGPMKGIPAEMMVRLTQLDYDRDIAFVAVEAPEDALVGIVRYATDPDKLSGEFGLLVRSDRQGRGLGRALLAHLVDYARAEGLGRLEGLILAENEPMKELCRALGFTLERHPDDPRLVRARLEF